MAFTAIEAFVNENIPAEFKYEVTLRNEIVKLKGVEIERQTSLEEKLKSVLPQAHLIKSPCGSAAWDKFKKLKVIRDRLVHMKSSDRNARGPEQQTIWGRMIQSRKENYAQNALEIIGAFPKLTDNRRWYRRLREQWCP